MQFKHLGPIFGDEIYWYCRIITNMYVYVSHWMVMVGWHWIINMVGAETPTHFCWLYDVRFTVYIHYSFHFVSSMLLLLCFGVSHLKLKESSLLHIYFEVFEHFFSYSRRVKTFVNNIHFWTLYLTLIFLLDVSIFLVQIIFDQK